MTYTTNHGKKINTGGHSPFIYKILGVAKVHQGVLTACIHPIHSEDKIGPVNAH